jgi:predicted nucleotidyltransferase
VAAAPAAHRELLDDFRRAVDAKIRTDLEREEALAASLRQEVVPAVRRGLREARRQGLCARAWLFGSYAWGKPSERSDVDLLVESSSDRMLVAAVVSEACGRDVHVVALERAPESLRERARAEGLEL